MSARVSAIRPSATLEVDARAKAIRAAGGAVIGFGAGESDFPTPEFVVTAAKAACEEARHHRYTPPAGLPELRSAIAAKTARDSQWHVDAEDVLVTNGGKHALHTAFTILLDPGDEVLLPAPYWTTYPELIALAGGVTRAVPTSAETGYKVTAAALDDAVSARTKALVIVSPSNPTGSVYSADELIELASWAHGHGLWIVTDEIYEHLVYDGVHTGSVPALVPQVADRTLVVNGVAKSHAMTGWRVGWLIGPRDVVKAATSLQSHTSSNVSNVAQAAATAAVRADLSAVVAMRETFRRRRDLIVTMLQTITGVTCPTPQGAFYVFPSVAPLLGRTRRGKRVDTSLELAQFLLDEAEVAVVPGEAFGSPGHLRLSYALGEADLVEGLERLQRVLG